MGYARAVEVQSMAALPLYGIPFAIKDNIDLADAPTTAACPAFAYTPQHNAVVVQRLIDAGAIPIGKTNLDQFATGLNGTRSPYGACRNAFDPNYISGGSSSGSAIALAKGLVCFSLGTDTAGSGRVPAAFNNLIGYKPTRGWLSTRGVVPACRSLDCVSIFAFTAADAERILTVAASYDAEDIYSREKEVHGIDFGLQRFRFGIPPKEQLQFFGNHEGERLFDEAAANLRALGGEAVEIDFAPFLETARLLYEGPWIAERYAAIQQFFEPHSDQMIPRYGSSLLAHSDTRLPMLSTVFTTCAGLNVRLIIFGRIGLPADANRWHYLYHSGNAARSHRSQCESWLLYQFHESARLCCSGGPRWISKRRVALRHYPGGACSSG